MSILVPADFRAASFDPACSGLLLTDDEANDVRLTEEIGTVTQRINELTDDIFEKQAGLTLEHDVYEYSRRLYLLQRFTAVTTVKTRDRAGTLTTQGATQWRLRSSLDAAGAAKQYDVDFLEIIPLSSGLSGPDIFSPWVWPYGTQTVQVTGDYGWTVTPGDVKRACAMIVWDTFKREAGDVRRASRWARGDLTVERAADTMTGMPEADELIKPYIRVGLETNPTVLIG
jgi:hypothetical protein